MSANSKTNMCIDNYHSVFCDMPDPVLPWNEIVHRAFRAAVCQSPSPLLCNVFGYVLSLNLHVLGNLTFPELSVLTL